MRQSNDALADDFRDFIESLNANAVLFVLVGGYALGWHGVVRATGDIDFLYDRTEENVARLCAAMGDFGAPENLIDPEFLMSPRSVTQIGIEPLRIDLLSDVSGVTFAAVRAGADEIELDGSRLLVIGIRELLANKAATGRAKDKSDLRRLDQAAAITTGRPARSGKKVAGTSGAKLLTHRERKKE